MPTLVANCITWNLKAERLWSLEHMVLSLLPHRSPLPGNVALLPPLKSWVTGAKVGEGSHLLPQPYDPWPRPPHCPVQQLFKKSNCSEKASNFINSQL